MIFFLTAIWIILFISNTICFGRDIRDLKKAGSIYYANRVKFYRIQYTFACIVIFVYFAIEISNTLLLMLG